MAQERLDEKLEKSSVVSYGTLRNLLLIAAGALLFFWPLAQRAFASIVACSGCSCVSEGIDNLASCTAIAQCTPEAKLLIVNASIYYSCPSQPVVNQATTTGYINGYNIFATSRAFTLYYNRVCINQWAIEDCNGFKTSGITSEDLYCCNPPPPPPPPCTICPKSPPVTCHSPCGSPIILDITGKGFILTSAQNGVMFDITGEGKLWQMGWIAQGANNAFLALPGADGLVHSGKQLFGNFTPQPPSTTPNGFAALAVYDDPKNGGNGDGIIDSRDAIFASLRLWIDANHDGISQPDELHTLASLGVNSISLKYKESHKTDQYGNVFGYRTGVNGNESQDVGQTAYDVFFVILNPTAKNNLLNREGNKCTVPTKGVTKGGMLSSAGGF